MLPTYSDGNRFVTQAYKTMVLHIKLNQIYIYPAFTGFVLTKRITKPPTNALIPIAVKATL